MLLDVQPAIFELKATKESERVARHDLLAEELREHRLGMAAA